jgi:hypothetical protein
MYSGELISAGLDLVVDRIISSLQSEADEIGDG